MAYVITATCVDVNDMACVEECPVDCIYEGARKSYIQPSQCINCAACQPVCPVGAIYSARQLPEHLAGDQQDNRAFFVEVLPGRDAPLGSPGGSRRTGPVGVDTPRIAALPARS